MNDTAPKKTVARPPRRSFAPDSALSIEAFPAPVENMVANKPVSMTLAMDFDWHLAFKMDAARRRISMKELVIQSYEALLEKERRLARERTEAAARRAAGKAAEQAPEAADADKG